MYLADSLVWAARSATWDVEDWHAFYGEWFIVMQSGGARLLSRYKGGRVVTRLLTAELKILRRVLLGVLAPLVRMTLSRQFPRVSGHLLDDAFQEGLFELSWRLDDLDFYPGTNPIAHAEAKSSWAIRNFLFHKVSSGISVHRWVVTRPRDFERGSFFDDDDDDHAVDRSVLDAILDRSVQTNLDTGALLDMYRLVLKSYFRLLRCCFFHRLTGAGAKLFDFVFQFYVVTGGHFPSIFVVRDRFVGIKRWELEAQMQIAQVHIRIAERDAVKDGYLSVGEYREFLGLLKDRSVRSEF
jgi:hypothetical protein